MARHSKASGRRAFSAPPNTTGNRSSHRAEQDRKPISGRVAAVVVAAGALATGVGAAGPMSGGDTPIIPLAASEDLIAALAATSAPKAPEVRTVHSVQPSFEAAKLMRSEGLIVRQCIDQAIQHASNTYTVRQVELKKQQEAAAAEQARVAAEQARVAAEQAAQQEAARVAAEQAAQQAAQQETARVAAEQAARRPSVVKPAEGSFTSGYGARWGTTHYGVDIANAIGTPILSVMDGVVVESGPASGFGLWVRVQHNDGTITIYGHVNETLVSQGQQVRAGQQIATMGNRGQSTGPHLHFEVWINGSQKIDPVGWLGERGISL
ncbi:murein DD-endopeptidase MepM/ murein hydrolase activator NlpD [Saccharothrix ecbatanensis]|uniref:Murein DD-endopeptidase MepM/ murein hydrolase activator NlpD n=1 Tax=Saccharothrix ecbatanensis TaxID=1105145 RepID=A0A7W9M1T8_9PSEU|nr:M23 family metallopeptidase [Saccharothrix ecbatanensis]MBB5804344.1 murein DD-endopeptidase MepM/ murein hydrolase activator NlpD [Saccharothrix ecbatanensis]